MAATPRSCSLLPEMTDECRRQRRLDRKRRRRKTRRRDQRRRHFTPEVVPAVTDMPKMSDTIVAFAQPLIDLLPNSATAAGWEKVLLLAPPGLERARG